MKLKFKVQAFQTSAVDSVVNCFAGQKKSTGIAYRLDLGTNKRLLVNGPTSQSLDLNQTGFKNEDIQLTDKQLLVNIQNIQRQQFLPTSTSLVSNAECKINLDVEMETGTGKTYCYIKTAFEMNKRYGWSKFIVIVPSIAIREGVLKSLKITSDHFFETYSKRARFFSYNSKRLHQLENFSSDAGINIMVINIQAFNATGKENRRIYDALDDFQSRKPIDVISGNYPILILDEPQKMEGEKTRTALAKFKPLMILRYSATHRTNHNRVYRLDSLDAYNQKLVKKIAARGISIRRLPGISNYLYLESIEISTKSPVARIEMEVRFGTGIKRVIKRLRRGKNLFFESNNLDQYQGFVISQINANLNTVEFTNGTILTVGDAVGDITEKTLRRLQIREALKAHFEKEQALFVQGIKVLSLFFIDAVSKYRDYSQSDFQGEYARIFEEEYELIKDEYLGQLTRDDDPYRRYLSEIPVDLTHNGYFSIDNRTNRLTDPKIKRRGESAGFSDDTAAYELILKDKERLLSFAEPVRFIFSHSALREGWDNPNVFVMCMLKHSDNTISRRQEVGRGLRISVNQNGDRMDNATTVHDVNVLTVVASESYKDFVQSLQEEISASLSDRPRKADAAYFTSQFIKTATEEVPITMRMARQIDMYLVKNNYIDEEYMITAAYHEARDSGTLAKFESELDQYEKQIFDLIDSVFRESKQLIVSDDRKPKINRLNERFKKKEFQALWSRINRKAVYRVEFDSKELIRECVQTLDSELQVPSLQFTIQRGVQENQISDSQLRSGEGFTLISASDQAHDQPIRSFATYDLLGKIAESTKLTRKTVCEILSKIQPAVFNQFRRNPEYFITESSRLINEQKATIIIQRLSYDSISETHDINIFTAGQTRHDFTSASKPLKKHIYDYAMTDSDVERKFVNELDSSNEVIVYAKLPRGFLIPTPVGDYNPDWAISFKKGAVRHIYFVAETKGNTSSMTLRNIENKKIECAGKFFEEVNRRIDQEPVKYAAVSSYSELMEIVQVAS